MADCRSYPHAFIPTTLWDIGAVRLIRGGCLRANNIGQKFAGLARPQTDGRVKHIIRSLMEQQHDRFLFRIRDTGKKSAAVR
ncbi:hypothetical protein C7N83_05575 [Neisseria iguanae]|uniref:Uncharacterized protein n=1 Tax=Neisseria iguanae TaxID=90242 RepID=A0A2P7U0P4_9NEIS|nr:hypothetical protein C7N83_05575 [Neisseria iguanae]